MSRAKYWQYLLNQEGQPIDHATVVIYDAGTYDAAVIYETETTLTVIPSATMATTDAGYFEFWVDPNDYPTGMKFDIAWSKPGSITAGGVDGVYIPMIYSQVNEADTDTTKDKLVSNNLAQTWSAKASVNTAVGVSASNFVEVTAGQIEAGFDFYYNFDHTLTQGYPIVSAYISGGRMLRCWPEYISNSSIRIWLDSMDVSGSSETFNFTVIG
jgi:hypothetical protein